MARAPSPITVAIVDDYRERVVVAELDASTGVTDPVDIALYDSFAYLISTSERSPR
ncbi:hypothetical protein [Mycobacterium sp.]|uniref:hypothetical protein n=1 Tax=Mycobacterium sp. TaxID=1785 RepID=UPI003D0A3342